MQVIDGGKPRERHPLTEKRRKLLAMVHMAKKDMGLDEDTYRAMLVEQFGVSSAAALSTVEMERLLKHMKSKGWKREDRRTPEQLEQAQLVSLKNRAITLAEKLENGEARLNGLCRKLFDVSRVEWVRDTGQMQRLLSVLNFILKEGE